MNIAAIKRYAMDTRKWHILIAVIILLVGIILLSVAERQIDPDAPVIWIALRDLGLALLVSAAPYALFKWIVSESPTTTIRYLGTKREAGPRLDTLIMGAHNRIDVIGLSLNDLFSGSVTPRVLVDKLHQGCQIRLFALDPTSTILDLRAADEGISPMDLRKRIFDEVDGKWRELNRLLEESSTDSSPIPGRLDLLLYASLPYFTVFRADETVILGLYNRNAACNTSAAFDISANTDLVRQFEEDLDYLAGSNLVRRKAIHFRGGSGAVFSSIYTSPGNTLESVSGNTVPV